MKKASYLFDTHAIIFWQNQVSVSDDFIQHFDKQEQDGTLFVSSISFWEIALLVKKDRLALTNVPAWKNELLNTTNLRLTVPSASEMIESTLLPDHHKDPFDRLLIVQAKQNDLILVTRDQNIRKYDVKHFWV